MRIYDDGLDDVPEIPEIAQLIQTLFFSLIS